MILPGSSTRTSAIHKGKFRSAKRAATNSKTVQLCEALIKPSLDLEKSPRVIIKASEKSPKSRFRALSSYLGPKSYFVFAATFKNTRKFKISSIERANLHLTFISFSRNKTF